MNDSFPRATDRSRRTGYRPDIDGLRALAIVPVILFHCDLAGWRSGFAGVDVFFVISGYLIAGQILRDLESGTFRFADFYARRARRIVPALALVAAASLVAGWILFFPTNYRDLGRSAAMLAAFVSNVFFWIKAGYFTAPAETKPLLHTWSISIEEQFYLVIPALLWVAWRWRQRGVVVALVTCLAASLAISLRSSATDGDTAFYLLQSRAWELAVGCLAATVPAALIRKLPGASLETASAIGFLMVLGGLAIASPASGWPAPYALLPCLGTAALLVANGGRPTAVGRLLSLPIPVAIGLRSYSLYLWHWPFLAFARYAAEAPLPPATACAIAALSVPVAWATFHLVEEPCRRAAAAAMPRVALTIAAMLLVALSVAGITISAADGVPGRIGSGSLAFGDDVSVAESRNAMCLDGTVGLPKGGVFCRVGTVVDDRPKVLLVGDSFADMYLATFRMLSVRFNREVWFLRDGHAPLDDRFFDAVRDSAVGDVVIAYSWRRALQAGIPEVAPSAGSGLLVPWLGYDPAALLRDHRREFREGLALAVERFVALGIRVHIVDSPPSYPVSVPLKLSLLVSRGRDPASFGMPLGDHLAMLAPVHATFEDLVGRGLVDLLRPADVLSHNGRCFVWADDHSLYSDDAHLSVYGANFVAPIFEKVFSAEDAGDTGDLKGDAAHP